MKQSRGLCVALVLVMLTLVFSIHEGSGQEPSQKGANSSVELVVTPRNTSWKLSVAQSFDVIVKNRTPDVIKVPYIYNSLIEIDGKLYTQFPKPKLSGEANLVIQGNEDATVGSLTLNGPLSTVDAGTGKLPLNLAAGKHQLVLICGPYRSNTVTFELIE